MMLTHDTSTYCALPFEEARAFARALKFRTGEEWKEYSKSGKVRKPIMLYPLYTLHTPFIHPLYTFIAVYAPMCTHYTCIYTHIHTQHTHL